jgi:D-alanyl-D-alanine dipeptidase
LGYIAEKSQHSRGGAVDLTLVHDSGDQEGEELDMGSPFDFFGGISGWDTQQITAQQMQHRLTLKELMSKHGFRSIKGEWWHYVLRAEPFPDTYFNFPSK